MPILDDLLRSDGSRTVVHTLIAIGAAALFIVAAVAAGVLLVGALEMLSGARP